MTTRDSFREEARQRFINTMRELLPPEDLRDIAAAARKAHREDFPEDFEVEPIRGVDYECFWCGDQGCTCWS